MRKGAPNRIFAEPDPELPALCKTRSGVEFQPSANFWKYRDGVNSIRLDFKLIRISPGMSTSLKRVLAWYAENESPDHLRNMFDRFRHFTDSVEINKSSIGSSHILNYRAVLTESTAWYLSSLSGLLKRWYRMKVPGVNEDAAKLLASIRVKGNRKGVAVLTMDPEHGPFTDMEFEAIRTSLKNAYESGCMGKGEYVLALLFIALGPRPAQYAAMKVQDIRTFTHSNGTTTYLVFVPRAKRRERAPRSSFAKRVVIPEIGVVVAEYAREIRDQFSGVLDVPEQAPLFPVQHRRGSPEPLSFEYHRTAKGLSEWFRNSMDSLHIRSERTGRVMNITSTRFRRTLACRAADEGHGELVIAELLDHTDTQNVGVYVEATGRIMERIDRAIAFKLAPLAQAFAGVIIDNESKSRRAGDLSSRIVDPRIDRSVTPIGNCGKFGFCGLLAPIACYTCRSLMGHTKESWTF